MNKTFLQAMQFRHACKKFDPDKKIAEKDFEQILEFGRLSPSSFGMEQWKFLVIQTPELRQKLQQACWNQSQISDCSHVIAIVAKIADILPGSDYSKAIYERKDLPEDSVKASLTRYANFHKNELNPYMSTFAWSAKQCYIALANMMTGAASLGIDSCPIEGFSKKDVDALLELDISRYQTAVVVCFGYRAGDQSQCFRQDINNLVEYR